MLSNALMVDSSDQGSCNEASCDHDKHGDKQRGQDGRMVKVFVHEVICPRQNQPHHCTNPASTVQTT